MLGLFSSIEANPSTDETKEGGILVEVKLDEQVPKSVDMTTQALFKESIQPVGSVSFVHHNICGLNRSIAGSVTSRNFLNSQLDKGLGIGSKNPFFNHNQITVTMFMNLNKQKNGAGKPPPASLIAHGRYV
ncbi:hypothetical protein QYE76_032890 [Lolium multiflorum]|uniref:Uncharacterized protein n=1 Tax=Lolium multiflorum TaxID=4521 RepID=A0AAD8QV24_LOLMU|nr:hypothetical protein QYE76_032890 [Lolium multiflorum]